MSLTFTDIFCGAGGSSTGLTAAGFELKLAANHSRIAISTHAANHPGAEHICADINNYDMRRLPRTDLLWASPICQESSPAGGRRRRAPGQLALDLEQYGAIETGAWERARATAYDVIRATEIHRYTAVLCENVVEFAADWELFDWWRTGMESLGYNSQVVSVSSAHVGDDTNPRAPQWRDRIYIVFTRTGIPLPDLAPRPLAWCPHCESDVHAVQAWRNGRRIGKYKQQYDYRCPNSTCRHAIVEPYVRPAACVIDWSNTGSKIGDRKRPLAAATMQRIRAGLAMFPETRTVLTVNHGGHDGRAFPADSAPLPARTVKIGEGLLVPCGGQLNKTATSTAAPMRTRMANPKRFEALLAAPFVIEYRNHATAAPVTDPLATVTGQGNHHGLLMPEAFFVKNYGGHADPRHMAKPVREPLGTITTSDHHSLVIPYRNAAPKTTAEPLHTISTIDSAALVNPAVEIEDCHFRMLQPREQLLAQRFPREYIVHGTKGEQTMQAGNAVSCNVAQWIAQRLAAALH